MLLKIEILLANYTQGILLSLVGEFRALAGLLLVLIIIYLQETGCYNIRKDFFLILKF